MILLGLFLAVAFYAGVLWVIRRWDSHEDPTIYEWDGQWTEDELPTKKWPQ